MKHRYCVTCRFWDAESAEDDAVGICRRYAPRSMIFEDPDAASREDYATWPMWPMVTQLEWCGEWESRK